jgi:glutaredoxin
MTDPKVTVYGAYWCPDCRRSKKFLGEQFIPFRWVDIEQDKAGEAYVLQRNNGKRIIPTVVFEDDSFLVEPSNAELAKKLGLKTEAKQTYYDLIIIGGGPAGLTAAIYASREGDDCLLIERSGLGGQAGITVGLDNFPGFPEGISGQEFSESLVWKFCRLWMWSEWKWRKAITKSTRQMANIITHVRSCSRPVHRINAWMSRAKMITSAPAFTSARRVMGRSIKVQKKL